MATTYTKLRDGSWGVRVEGPAPAAGLTVTVTKKSGETKAEKIGKVLWTGNGVSLCSIEGSKPANGSSNGQTQAPRRGRSCSCTADCCRNGCRCESHCNCRGGNIYDC